MSDWNFDPELVPGKVGPDTKPIDPGWAEWIKKGPAAEVDKDAKGTVLDWSVSMSVERTTETVDYAVSGSDPSPWEKEGLTWETIPPSPYADFTRFKRTYASLTVKRFTIVKVLLIITWRDNTGKHVWVKNYVFHEVDEDSKVAYRDVVVYRWVQTSSLTGGEVPGKKYNPTPPSAYPPGLHPDDRYDAGGPDFGFDPFDEPPADVKKKVILKMESISQMGGLVESRLDAELIRRMKFYSEAELHRALEGAGLQTTGSVR